MEEKLRKAVENLDTQYGTQELLWAVHNLIGTKAAEDKRWTEVEVKLAECAEAATDLASARTPRKA